MGTKYTALTPIEHDGERVEEGGTLTLDDKHAAPLLKLNAVEAETSSRKRGPRVPVDPIAIQREAEESARLAAEESARLAAEKAAAGGAGTNGTPPPTV